MKTVYEQLVFPFSVALVRHDDNRCYLFRVPAGCVLAQGDQVICKTTRGEQPGTVESIAQIASQSSLEFLMKAMRVDRLEPVIARVTRYGFGDNETYRLGKGLEKKIEDRPVVITSPDEPPLYW